MLVQICNSAGKRKFQDSCNWGHASWTWHLPPWWVFRHSQEPRCAGESGGAAGGSCCWAYPDREGSATSAARNAAIIHASWCGLRQCCYTCSTDIDTSTGEWENKFKLFHDTFANTIKQLFLTCFILPFYMNALFAFHQIHPSSNSHRERQTTCSWDF